MKITFDEAAGDQITAAMREAQLVTRQQLEFEAGIDHLAMVFLRVGEQARRAAESLKALLEARNGR